MAVVVELVQGLVVDCVHLELGEAVVNVDLRYVGNAVDLKHAVTCVDHKYLGVGDQTCAVLLICAYVQVQMDGEQNVVDLSEALVDQMVVALLHVQWGAVAQMLVIP